MNEKAFSVFLAGVVSTVGVFISLSYQFYIAAFTLILFDYVTGLYKAAYKRKLSSRVAKAGLWRKLGLLIAITFGWVLQVLQVCMITPLLGVNLPIGVFVSTYIIIMEVISISENLESCGVLPPFVSRLVRKYLEAFNKQLEDTIDGEKTG